MKTKIIAALCCGSRGDSTSRVCLRACRARRQVRRCSNRVPKTGQPGASSYALEISEAARDALRAKASTGDQPRASNTLRSDHRHGAKPTTGSGMK